MQIQAYNVTLPNGSSRPYPKPPRKDQVDEIHGVKVADPFRPLEKLNAPSTRSWVAAENRLTRSYLDQIPEREEFRQALDSIRAEVRGLRQVQGDRVYFSKSTGGEHPLICEGAVGSDEERVLLDPNEFSKDGHISIDQWKVSPDGSKLVYGIRRNGTDEMEWRVRDLSTGKDFSERVKNGRYGADSLSWSEDSKGFFYHRYKQPKVGQAIMQVVEYENTFYHKLGTPQSVDKPEGSEGLPKQDWSEKKVDGNDWSRLGDDGAKNVVMSKGPWHPRGAILSWDEENEVQKVLVPQRDMTLEGGCFAHGQIFAQYLKNAHSHLVRYDKDGKELGEIELPGEGTVSGLQVGADGKVFYSFSSPTQPPTIYAFDTRTGKSEIAWKPELNVPMDRYVTERVMMPSKDGTEIPVFITRRKDVELKDSPCYLYAYGGFGVSETPVFDWTKLPWLDKGGIYATAALRGGGENGEEWHKDGARLRKQNVFDDFISVAEGLVQQGARVGIGGGSNGGLLVAATELQRPDLFGAALPEVGVHDMIRFPKYTGGFHWIPEYGEVEKPNLFKKMLSYSPVHNVVDGKEYPPTMVMTGDHDDRVVPSHSYKLAAELQDSQGGENPILLRTERNIGHGFGMPRTMRVEENADRFAFLWEHLT